MNENTQNLDYLPQIGDMWELGRNGLAICVDLDIEKKQIQWYEIVHQGYFKGSFRSFRKFLKKGWAIKQ